MTESGVCGGNRDLQQELALVLLSLVRSATGLDQLRRHAADVPGYLAVIAWHLWNHMTTRKRLVLLGDARVFDAVADPHAEPVRVAVLNERIAELTAAIDQLPPKERTAVRGRLADLTNTEIARLQVPTREPTGADVHAVESQVSRARTKLRRGAQRGRGS